MKNMIMELTDKEFEVFQKVVMSILGIQLSDAKRPLVVSRLLSRLKHLQLKSFSEYIEYLCQSPMAQEELTNFINQITTNETYFFREQQHFDFLQQQVMPGFHKSKRGEIIRVWSSACSSGEEPYSIAFIFSDFIKQNASFRVKILASDVSTKVLRKAEEGVYSKERISKIPMQNRLNYFTQIEEDKYQVKEEIRALITFKNLNLMDQHYPLKAPLDILFCRNVMIYFSEDSKTHVLNNFYRYLKDDGFLFMGHSESLINCREKFKVIQNTIFKKNI